MLTNETTTCPPSWRNIGDFLFTDETDANCFIFDDVVFGLWVLVLMSAIIAWCFSLPLLWLLRPNHSNAVPPPPSPGGALSQTKVLQYVQLVCASGHEFGMIILAILKISTSDLYIGRDLFPTLIFLICNLFGSSIQAVSSHVKSVAFINLYALDRQRMIMKHERLFIATLLCQSIATIAVLVSIYVTENSIIVSIYFTWLFLQNVLPLATSIIVITYLSRLLVVVQRAQTAGTNPRMKHGLKTLRRARLVNLSLTFIFAPYIIIAWVPRSMWVASYLIPGVEPGVAMVIMHHLYKRWSKSEYYQEIKRDYGSRVKYSSAVDDRSTMRSLRSLMTTIGGGVGRRASQLGGHISERTLGGGGGGGGGGGAPEPQF